MSDWERIGRFRSLASRLTGRASSAAEGRVGDSFDSRLIFSVELADHNEATIGLECLCENLFEYEVALSREEYDELRDLARHWIVEDRYGQLLTTLIKDV